MCARVGREVDLLRDRRTILVRSPADGGGFEERWIPRPSRPPPAEPPEPPVDEARVAGIARRCQKGEDVWECGQFGLMGARIGDRGERPYFPAAFLIVQSGSGLVLHAGIDRPPFPPESLSAAFLDTVEKLGAVPRQVAVADARARRALGPAARKLGVKVTAPESLPTFEIVRASLERHMG